MNGGAPCPSHMIWRVLLVEDDKMPRPGVRLVTLINPILTDFDTEGFSFLPALKQLRGLMDNVRAAI
jgi:hypothetical protein